jgi:hypothetical protein
MFVKLYFHDQGIFIAPLHNCNAALQNASKNKIKVVIV